MNLSTFSVLLEWKDNGSGIPPIWYRIYSKPHLSTCVYVDLNIPFPLSVLKKSLYSFNLKRSNLRYLKYISDLVRKTSHCEWNVILILHILGKLDGCMSISVCMYRQDTYTDALLYVNSCTLRTPLYKNW